MRSHTPDDQARIRLSVQQLNAGVLMNTVMANLDLRLVGAVAAAIIESAIVSNVSANDLLGHLGMNHMTVEETQEFGYTGDSRASVGLLPPTACTTALSRYLHTILLGPLPQSVEMYANALSPEDQAYIRRGLGRLRTGTPASVLAAERHITLHHIALNLLHYITLHHTYFHPFPMHLK